MSTRCRRAPERTPGCALAAMAHAIGLVAVLAILPAAAQAQTGGRARVIDGDTLVLKEGRIRLSGIDAPEAAQSCLFEGE